MRVLRGLVYLMKSRDREQSLGEHHRRRCTQKTDQYRICHGRNEMTSDLNQLKTEPSIQHQDGRQVMWYWGGSESGQGSRSDFMRWSWIYKRAVSVEWCLHYADWRWLSNLLEVRCFMRRDLILFWIWEKGWRLDGSLRADLSKMGFLRSR